MTDDTQGEFERLVAGAHDKVLVLEAEFWRAKWLFVPDHPDDNNLHPEGEYEAFCRGAAEELRRVRHLLGLKIGKGAADPKWEEERTAQEAEVER